MDLVVHSSTKYLGGHGDVTGGVVVAARKDGLFERVRQVQQDGGAVPSPFDCWLLLEEYSDAAVSGAGAYAECGEGRGISGGAFAGGGGVLSWVGGASGA